MLLLGSKTFTVDGITVFSDHADPNQFWYLPAPVGLETRDDGEPQFTLITYRPAVVQAGVKGGGYLMFTSSLPVDALKESQIRSQIATYFPDVSDPRVSVVPFDEGSVQCVALDLQGSGGTVAPAGRDGAFVAVEKILGASVPSLMGNNDALFSLTVSQDAAGLFEQAFANQLQPVGVIYQLKYTGVRPALDVVITADLKKVYDGFSAGLSAQAYYVTVGIDAAFEKLVQDGAIQVKVVNLAPNDAENKEKEQWALQLFKDNLLNDWFKPSLSPTTAAAIDVGVPPLPSSGGGSGAHPTTPPIGGGTTVPPTVPQPAASHPVIPQPPAPGTPVPPRPAVPPAPIIGASTPATPGTPTPAPGTPPSTTPPATTPPPVTPIGTVPPATTPPPTTPRPTTPLATTPPATAADAATHPALGGASVSIPTPLGTVSLSPGARSVATAAKAPQAVAAGVNPANMATGAAPFGAALRLKYVHQDELKTVRIEYQRQDAVQRIYAPQGYFGVLLSAANRSKHVLDADLDNPWFRTLKVIATPPADFAKIGLGSLHVAIDYGDPNDPPRHKHGEMMFDLAQQAPQSWEVYKDITDSREYKYTVDWHFDPTSHWRGEKASYSFDPATSENSDLYLNPSTFLTFVEVLVSPGRIDWALVDYIEVDLEYTAANGWHTAEHFEFRSDTKAQSWKFRLTGANQPLSYTRKFTHHLKDGTTVVEPVATSAVPAVVVRDPFFFLNIEARPMLDPTKTKFVYLDIAYEDPALNYTYEQNNLVFSPAVENVVNVRVPILDQDKKEWKYRSTIVGVHNEITRGAWTPIENDEIFVTDTGVQ